MRLQKLRIENFRSFRDETVVFDRYTCLVGQNGAGKSTVLAALNVLFRVQAPGLSSPGVLVAEDFHQRDIASPVRITATFTELSAEAQADFKAYFRQGSLVIAAEAFYDPEDDKADVRQLGARMVLQDLSPWFALADRGAKVPELKAAYELIRRSHPQLPAPGTKQGMQDALRAYEENNPRLCELTNSGDQFYGWSRGDNLLRKYVQWVYVPAVKDASAEQIESKSSAIGQLLERSIRPDVEFAGLLDVLRSEVDLQYQNIAAREAAKLVPLGQALQQRLRRWSHSGAQLQLEWHWEKEKAISFVEPVARIKAGDSSFLGDLARLGHGLQRTVILSLLQELAEFDSPQKPTLILGFEEPELYQHPPQARHIASALQELAEGNAQVVVTTHSPYFVGANLLRSTRLVRRGVSGGTLHAVDLELVAGAVAEALQDDPASVSALTATLDSILQPTQAELFFCGLPVLLEGLEDLALLAAHAKVTGVWQELRSRGVHMIPVHGKTNMSRPLAIANALQVPAFVIFDADGDCNTQQQERNERDNACLFKLANVETEPFPVVPLFTERLIAWPCTIMKAIRTSVGDEDWLAANEDARARHKLQGVSGKNSVLLAATIESLAAAGVKVPVLDSALSTLGAFASKAGTAA